MEKKLFVAARQKKTDKHFLETVSGEAFCDLGAVDGW